MVRVKTWPTNCYWYEKNDVTIIPISTNINDMDSINDDKNKIPIRCGLIFWYIILKMAWPTNTVTDSEIYNISFNPFIFTIHQYRQGNRVFASFKSKDN